MVDHPNRGLEARVRRMAAKAECRVIKSRYRSPNQRVNYYRAGGLMLVGHNKWVILGATRYEFDASSEEIEAELRARLK